MSPLLFFALCIQAFLVQFAMADGGWNHDLRKNPMVAPYRTNMGVNKSGNPTTSQHLVNVGLVSMVNNSPKQTGASALAKTPGKVTFVSTVRPASGDSKWPSGNGLIRELVITCGELVGGLLKVVV